MGEPAKCVPVLDAVNDTAMIAVRLVDRSILKSPKLIVEALQSEQGRKALEAALLEVAKERLKDAPVQFSAEDSQKLAGKLRDAGVNGLRDGVLEQVKKSPEYKRLENSADRIFEALKCSPAGVWVDEHDALVYILGAGLILGGATALYVARTGDAVADPVTTLIKDKKVKITARPSIEISGSVTKFIPSQRAFEVGAEAIAKWKPLQVKLNVTVQGVNDKFSVAGSGQVILPFRGGEVRIEGSHNARDPKVAPTSLGFAVEAKPQGVNIGIVAGLQFKDGLQPAGGTVGVRVGPTRRMPVSLGGNLTTDQEKTLILFTLQGRF